MASNPVFNEEAFEKACQRGNLQEINSNPMTLQGTINKTFFLLFLCVCGAMFAWNNFQTFSSYLTIMSIGALAVGVATAFKPAISPYTAPLYAVLEGVLLGVLSAYFNTRYPGIVFNAVSITFLVFFTMLFLYKTGIIRPTKTFVIGVVSATCAIALFYIGSMVLSLFGVSTNYLTSSSPLSIGISIVICIVAALNFILDFSFIDTMTREPLAPKYMEWYASFGLLVTLLWMYVEVLKLLAKSQRK